MLQVCQQDIGKGVTSSGLVLLCSSWSHHPSQQDMAPVALSSLDPVFVKPCRRPDITVVSRKLQLITVQQSGMSDAQQ